MALKDQVQIMNVDTGDFYSNKETRLHKQNHKVRRERKQLKEKIKKSLEILGSEFSVSEEELKTVYKDYQENDVIDLDILNKENLSHEEYYNLHEEVLEYCKLNDYLKRKQILVKSSKEKLLKKMENKVKANIASKGKHHIRKIKDDILAKKDDSIISIFESDSVRTLGIKKDEFSDSLVVVQVYYFDVFKDIMHFGFEYKGEKYIYYTSSAGQIRKKKAVFIKEKEWNKHKMTLMCGLTVERINEKGGSNPNKYLAYTALQNSATDLWEEFDIDKTIVVEDFENDVLGIFDLIDDTDYSITRKRDYVPVPHTDGCGMMLPKLGNNRMVRLSWIKGLLGKFDFVKFIKENNCSGIIKDIYGKEHDIIEEGIEIIFTKSQFKMWKYYESWEEYKECFKKYNCKAGYTNLEQDKISYATINYQMLQTFTEFTEEDIERLIWKSVCKLKNIGSSVENMKEIFGVVDSNENKSYLQKAVEIYPNIMNDEFFKIQLRNLKDSLIKKYKSGKLEVNGKYTFVLPDLYACCEHWFLGEENPKGLLADGEVFCKLFKNNHELDCLRSPHLYKEHCVRYNIACKRYNDRNEELYKWFDSNAIYTSCHDLISKILQFDVDGDTLLVVAEKVVVELAKRNTIGIVPLYYNMKKAEAVALNNKSIYEGLIYAFTSGNIGLYSNDISIIWNSDVFINGTEEEKQETIDIVKLLCMENNFVIDSAKTLYKPTRPKEIDEKIKAFTKNKLPHFFIYAKDKEKEQVEEVNKTLVNRLDKAIPNPKIDCRKIDLGKINYKVLMDNSDIEVKVKFDEKGRMIEEETDEVILAYSKIIKENLMDAGVLTKIQKISSFDIDKLEKWNIKQKIMKDMSNKIIDELMKYGYSKKELADIFVKFQYHIKPNKRKTILWLCFGDIIFDNIEKNLKTMTEEELNMAVKECDDCGKEFFVKANSRIKRCDKCRKKRRGIIVDKKCIDCGKLILLGRKKRCDDCNRVYEREKKRKQRENKNK